MIKTQIELQILEAKIGQLRLSKDSSTVLYKVFEERLFDSLNIDREKYARSFEYYMNDIEAMDKIYEAVIDSLSLRERLIQEQK